MFKMQCESVLTNFWLHHRMDGIRTFRSRTDHCKLIQSKKNKSKSIRNLLQKKINKYTNEL
ncbi:hypothetical protein BpHYR1_050877 [Brachionus plicatilis]|uniref:Uncharacterized protein n=1 Tax=Brachionus plicatilis TaxID=10195 RepID=A0A3M7PG42_BRAPC|nr:hypothetical protein BpHYR1_050877 [Brachionus plicatilis]